MEEPRLARFVAMRRRAHFLLWFVLVAALLAGCTQRTEKQDAPPADSQPATSASAPPDTSAPPVVDVFASAFDMAFHATACRNPRVFWMVEKAVVQPLLPPGFVAANFTDAFYAFQFPGYPPEQATPQTLVLYDAVTCDDVAADTPIAGFEALTERGVRKFANVGVFVEQPDLGAAHPLEDVLVDVYMFATLWSDGNWSRFYQRLGFDAADAAVAQISGEYGLLPGGLQDGHAVVADERGTLMEVTYHEQVPFGRRTFDHAHYRYWHVGAAGTLAIDNVQTDETLFGPLDACAHRPGSWYERTTGLAECGTPQLNPGALVGIGVDTEFVGTYRWWPGVYPV